MGRPQPERDDTLYDLLCLLYPDAVERAQAAVRLAVRTYTPEGGVVALPPPISTTAALRTTRARIAPKEEDESEDGGFYAAYPTPAANETDEDEAEEDEIEPDGGENIAKDSDEEASCEWVWLKDRGLRERAKEAEQERATSRKRRRHTIATTSSTTSLSAGTGEEHASGSRKKRRRRSPGESRFLDGARVPLHGSGKDEGSLPLVADEYERNKAKALLRDMRDSLGLPPVNNKVRMLHWSLEEGHEYERIMAEKKGEFIRWMDEQGLRPTTVRAKKRLWEYLGDFPQVALCRVGLRRWERGITIQLLREAIDADPDEKAFWSQPLTDQQRELIKLAGP
ncbi:uncharacterized protein ACA1_399600 [Acanthamoeba castellanii str. Neff]|uniref:Uncharacterized protein n=1 Tax=Acanthamoeba castellanii (strain ATCC 30010 / Neff) TaxID=1257118 RepID=L8GFY3_ACACF|nr:uncharacterized protein ACA1_399600 [Acanthamoeba castellanii str. Neff]ELR11922.1 hypothetical protein ACA1_399600 [Acanthamoeba castellanii str. Neff]